MLVGLLHFFRGSVQFSIEGSPERFYNQCAKQGIPLWGIQGAVHTALSPPLPTIPGFEPVPAGPAADCAYKKRPECPSGFPFCANEEVSL